MDIDNAVVHLYPASPYICKACVNLRRGGKVVMSVPLANSKACFDFLHIFNNVKSQSGLIRVWNDYRNNVYVVCTEEMHEATRDYLSQFGEVHYDRPVQIVRLPDYDSNFNHVKAWEYDMDKYDDLVVDPCIE